MKSTAVVINTARGQVIDEVALLSSLQAGAIGGAGLDVFETEPLPRNHPLGKLSNVVLTGHVASHTQPSSQRMIDAAVQGILDVADGRIPAGCLNPQAVGDRHD
jgi:phosphoglycerate dehydrogenase-like enzyme